MGLEESAPPPSSGQAPLSSRPPSSLSRESPGSGRHRSRTVVGSTNRPRTTPTPRTSSEPVGDGSLLPPAGRRYSLLPEPTERVSPLEEAASRPGPAFRSNQEVPSGVRHDVSATWTHKLVPLPRDWRSEAKANLVPQLGLTHPSDPIIKKLKQKRVQYYQDTQELRLSTAKRRLLALARLKYGSLRNMFTAVRLDGRPVISLLDFSTAIREANLEPFFPRNVQRLLFERVPGERYERAPLEALISMVEPAAEAVDKAVVKGSAGGGEGDGSVVDEVEVERISKSSTGDLLAEEGKVALNRRVHDRCKAMKVPDEWPEDRMYLYNALQQADTDMCGYLSQGQVAAVFNKTLGLKVEEVELQHLLGVAGRKDPQGRVKYKDLLNVVELLRPEPNYNPVFDRREAVLKTTQDYYNEPHHWDPEMAAAVYRIRQAKHEGSVRLAKEHQERDEQMRRTEADEQAARIRDAREFTAIRPENLEFSVWDSLPPEIRTATASVSSSNALFRDMDETNHAKMTGICGRFTVPPPTDWSRVGYGGDGVDERSGLYMASTDQFTTSTATYYRPIDYQPNRPPQRGVMSDAEREAWVRRQRILSRKQTHSAHLQRIRETAAVDHYDMKMKDDCRIKAKTAQALGYLEEAHRADFFRDLKETGMQKRCHKAAARRMFGGSTDQQFNLIQRAPSDERDFKSTYAADFVPVPAA